MEYIKKILRTPSALVILLAGILALIGVIFQSKSNERIAKIPIEATSTAEAKLTEFANATDDAKDLLFTEAPTLSAPLSTIITPIETTPSEAMLAKFNDLDQTGEWKGYTEGYPDWSIKSVTMPSIDGKSLQCSISGGDPYSNLHCYLNLPIETTANIFELNLSFWFSPATSCNNQEVTSTVQALEFTMNKWYQDKRYEIALQWQNAGNGAPQWRYWNPHENEKWIAISPVISDCLEAQRWHTFTMKGAIQNGLIYYESFAIDSRDHDLNLFVPPISTAGEVDRLAVAVQLDGNANQTPFDVYVDKVTFLVKTSQP